jgi:hypothetical protein
MKVRGCERYKGATGELNISIILLSSKLSEHVK